MGLSGPSELVFVTQLPRHLPNEVLGLINNFIIHKITVSTVISWMQRTVGSIDERLWNRVPRLARARPSSRSAVSPARCWSR